MPITESDRQTIVDLLDTRSNGNALYATYLCRYATGASLLGQSAAAPATEHSARSNGLAAMVMYDVTTLLCRHRHNKVYADLPVMPISRVSALVGV